MDKWLTWLVVAVVVAATASCTSQGTSAGARADVSRPPVHRATTTTAAPAAVSVQPFARVAVTDSAIGPMALVGTRVVFPIGPRGSDQDSVGVFDTQTRTLRMVARSAYEQGLINWVVGAGDWVAWVDQSRRQSDFAPNVLWNVWALNTSTGEKRLLDSSGDKANPFVPPVRARGDYFFWATAEADRTAREKVWRPAWTQPHALLRHAELTPGSETAVDNHLVYLGPAGTRHHGHTIGGDCWTTPLDGNGRPKPLTRTGLAMGCAVNEDGALVWSEHIAPNTRPLPTNGVLDDPYQLRTQTFASLGADATRKPRLLHRGYVSSSYPGAGTGFAAWTYEGVVIHALSSKDQVTLPGSIDMLSVTTAGDDLIAYRKQRGKTTTLIVSRVRTQ